MIEIIRMGFLSRYPFRELSTRSDALCARAYLFIATLSPPPCSMAQNIEYDVPNLAERLQYLRKCSGADIMELSRIIQGFTAQLPQDYLTELTSAERIVCLRAAIVCRSVTQGMQVPRKMQLQAILAAQLGHDSLISAGTGSGKTFPIAVNILLEDPADRKITITVSPLKRLQATQQTDFSERYGIRTFVINEDTPREEGWWTVCFSFRD